MNKLFLWACMFFISTQVFAADRPLRIVTTTTYFAELMKEIGGDRVSVHTVASPKFNVHFVQPKPSDVARTAKADVFVFAGLDLEAWADPLLEASGRHDLFRGQPGNLDLSRGIQLQKTPQILTRAEGDLHAFGNPHYTLNPENAKVMARSVSQKLQEIDPSHANEYAQNESSFLTRLGGKIAEWKALCAHCAGKEVFAYHDDVVYLTDFLGIKEGQYLEPKPGVSPSPKHLAFLENYAKEKQVRAILFESYFSKKMVNRFAEKIGAQPVMIIQSPGQVKGAEDIFSFYDYNIRAIAAALE